MEARLQFVRYPTALAVLFIVAAALLLGGTLGYAVRQVTTPVPTRIVFVHQSPGAGSGAWDECVWLQGHKAC